MGEQEKREMKREARARVSIKKHGGAM